MFCQLLVRTVALVGNWQMKWKLGSCMRVMHCTREFRYVTIVRKSPDF